MTIKKINQLKLISKIVVFSVAVIAFSGNTFAFDADANNTNATSNYSAPSVCNIPTGAYFGINTLIIAWGAELGNMFTPNFGLEVGASTSWVILGVDDIYYLDAKGVLPIGKRGQFFAKLGVGAINSQMVFNSNTMRVGPTYGVGLGYAFSHNWLGSIEVNGIYAGLSGQSHNHFVSMPTVGLSYYFSA